LFNVQNFVEVSQNVAEIWRFFYSGHPPSWTTHKEYFMVFINVKNLAGIDEVVLIICRF